MEKHCSNCNRLFNGRTDAKYCGPSCRQMAHEKRTRGVQTPATPQIDLEQARSECKKLSIEVIGALSKLDDRDYTRDTMKHLNALCKILDVNIDAYKFILR